MKEVTELKRRINKALIILLCLTLTVVSVFPAVAVAFPQGVTEQTAQAGAQKADILIKNALNKMQGKTLKELVLPMIISDDTLSKMLFEVYTSVEEQGQALSDIGLDTSPQAVAKYLSAYPDIYARLVAAPSWSQVNLAGAHWGVSDEEGFANATSAMLGVFNDLLYALLCSSSYRTGLVSISGDDGYQNGIVPILDAIGCPNIMPNVQFKEQAATDYSSMIRNIVLMIFSYLDYVLDAPCVRLSETLPNFAYFINNDGLTTSINALISPMKLKIANLIPIMSGSSILSFVENSDDIMSDFSSDPMQAVNGMLSESEITMADIDLEKLASCGVLQNGKIQANIGEAFTVIFMWLIDTLKLNKDKLAQSLNSENAAFGDMNIGDMSGVLNTLLEKDSGDIFALLIELLTAEGGNDLDYKWETPAFAKTDVSYTANLGQDKFQRVLDGIDELLSEFVKESGEKNIQSVLKKTIYSPELVSSLVTGIYGAFAKDDFADMLSLIGFDVTPKGLASVISESEFSSVKLVLSSKSSWSKVKETELNWNFKKGDRESFKKAVTAALRPLEDILRMILVSEKIEVLGAINIYGTNGYNSAVIPLLEALGCPNSKIMTYDELKKNSDGDKIIENLLNPIFALVDKVIKKPVYTITEILPNIVFFVNNGSAVQCIMNLITPITDMLEKFGMSADSLGFNIDEMKNADILAELTKNISAMVTDIKLPDMDFASLSGIGEPVTVQSKAIYRNAPIQTVYVKADQTAVIVTLLRYLVDVIRMPENSSILDSFLSSGDAEENTFTEFSSGIGEQMASMTTDETIEWLYKLFFRERVVSENVVDDDYTPTIIYKPKSNGALKGMVGFICALLLAAIVLLIIFRKRIIEFIISKSFRKPEDKASVSDKEV